MKAHIIKLLKLIGLYKEYKIPHHISSNYIELSSEKDNLIRTEITNYCNPDNYDSKQSLLQDIDALLFERLNKFRQTHVPFLAESIGLANKQILEIGCGSGSSSVALSEQGAKVTGIDIDEKAIELAKKRAKIYGVSNVSFSRLNATEIDTLKDKNWDIVIFFASLEHMTPKERLIALRKALNLLEPGGHLCIFGTPNRLWPYDIHTSWLPFYLWLQDEVALDYAKFSPRTEFSKLHADNIDTAYESLYRWGRGVSFHELELAWEGLSKFKVIGSLPIFLRRYSFLQKISYKRSDEYKLKQVISKFGPEDVHPGFYECYLDLIIEK